MSTLKVDTIQKADGTGSLSVPAESGTVVTTASPSLGRRNLIINGAMQVAQRGTSVTCTSSVTYGLDRWWGLGGGANITMSQVTGTSYPYAMRLTGATSNTLAYFGHRVEAANVKHLAGQDVTVSFNIKASTSQTVYFDLRYATANDDFSGGTDINTETIGVTTTDTRKTYTISIPSAATTGLELRFRVNTGLQSGETIDVSGVQLEVGSVATPFEHRSYGEELALCQRYYEKSYPVGTAPGTSGIAEGLMEFGSTSYHNNYCYQAVFFVTPKRASPTITLKSYTGLDATWNYERSGANGAVSSTGSNIGPNTFNARVPVGAAWTGIYMYGHFVADAEL